MADRIRKFLSRRLWAGRAESFGSVPSVASFTPVLCPCGTAERAVTADDSRVCQVYRVRGSVWRGGSTAYNIVRRTVFADGGPAFPVFVRTQAKRLILEVRRSSSRLSVRRARTLKGGEWSSSCMTAQLCQWGPRIGVTRDSVLRVHRGPLCRFVRPGGLHRYASIPDYPAVCLSSQNVKMT
jgi:hypothetical protein